MNKLLETPDGKLEVYDEILSNQRYLAGNVSYMTHPDVELGLKLTAASKELTLADLFHLPYGSLLPSVGYHGMTDGSKPNLARYGHILGLTMTQSKRVQVVEGCQLASVMGSAERHATF